MNSEVEVQLLALINNLRAANGVAPLAFDPALNKAAAWMSQDMATNDNFSHTDSLGRSPFTRFAVLGAHNGLGENLAAGYPDAQTTFNQFNSDQAHRDNMLRDRFNVIGISRVYNPNSRYKYYWTTDFGYNSTQSTGTSAGTGTQVATGKLPSGFNVAQNTTMAQIDKITQTGNTTTRITTGTTSATGGRTTAPQPQINTSGRIRLDQVYGGLTAWQWVVFILIILLLIYLVWKN